MATATKQIFYSSPRRPLLKKRKAGEARPSITVTMPFSFSARLASSDRRFNSAASLRRSSASSLPRLPQQSAKHSATENSSSQVKKSGSQGGTSSEGVVDPRSTVVTGNSDPEVVELLSPEEEEERRLTNQKCLQWLEGLPSKFSGMHIVQQMVYNANR